jgi:tetratricopeptide (TPR) repeat protein
MLRASAKAKLKMYQEAVADLYESTNILHVDDNPKLVIDSIQAIDMQISLPEFIEHCNKAIEVDPKNGILYTYRGYFKGLNDEPAVEVIKDFNRAIELDEKSSESYAARCIFKQANRQFREGLKDCRKVLELNPDNSKIGGFIRRLEKEASFEEAKEIEENAKRAGYFFTSGRCPEITSLAIDRGNSLWIGTRFSGLYRTTSGKTEHFDASNPPIESMNIDSVFVASDNTTWVISRSQVLSYKDQSWTVHQLPEQPDKPQHPYIWFEGKFAEGKDQKIFLCLNQQGFMVYNGQGKFSAVPEAPQGCQSIFADSNQVIYVISGDLKNYSFDGKSWKVVNDEDARSRYSLTGDSSPVWKRQDTPLELLMELGRFQDFKPLDRGLMDPEFNFWPSMRASRNGDLARIYMGRRVEFLHKGKISEIDRVRGFEKYELEITDMLFDDLENLLISTRFNGVFRLSPPDYDNLEALPNNAEICGERNSDSNLFPWRIRSWQELSEAATELVTWKDLIKDPVRFRGKKVHVVSGGIRRGFEYASLIDEDFQYLGIWPSWSHTRVGDAAEVSGCFEENTTQLYDVFGYLEYGPGFLAGSRFQFMIVECYRHSDYVKDPEMAKVLFRKELMKLGGPQVYYYH